MTRAMRPKTDVPDRPNAPMAATASMGPNTNRCCPLWRRGSGPCPWKRPKPYWRNARLRGGTGPAPTPLRAMAVKMAQ